MIYKKHLFTGRKRSLEQGNIFTPVCHSVHRGGVRGCSGGCVVARGHAWFLGGACVVPWEACVVTPGGHAWLLGGRHAWLLRGACMVSPGGHAWLLGRHVWLLQGGYVWLLQGGMRGFIWEGVHGFIWGACVVLFRGGMRGFFSFFGYNEIRSISGRYASYWNAFLFKIIIEKLRHFYT